MNSKFRTDTKKAIEHIEGIIAGWKDGNRPTQNLNVEVPYGTTTLELACDLPVLQCVLRRLRKMKMPTTNVKGRKDGLVYAPHTRIRPE